MSETQNKPTTPASNNAAPPKSANAAANSATHPWNPRRRLHRADEVLIVEDLAPITVEDMSWKTDIKEEMILWYTNIRLFLGYFVALWMKLTNRWIHPKSPTIQKIKILLAISIILQVTLIPLRLSWSFSTWPYQTFWIILDMFADFIYLVDLTSNFFVAYMEDGSSKLVTDRQAITRNYIKTSFKIHLFASLPLDFLALKIGLDSLPYLRLPKLLRILELMPVFSELERVSGMHMIRVVGLWALFLSFAHWSGCMWFLTAKVNNFDHRTWAYRCGISDAAPTTQYIYSVYWALIVMATIGFGDIIPITNEEKIYTMFAMMFGATVHSVVLGNISTIVAQLDAAAIRYRQKLDVLHLYMRYRNLPDFLRLRILDYYDVSWSRHKGLDETTLMNELPSSLRSEIALYLHTKLIENVPLFKGMKEPGFIDSLVVMLKPQIALSGDYIIRQGEIGREMYFIVQGEVDVVSADEKVVYAVLREGSYFGEIALLFAARRIASVKARGYCDLLVLTREDFDSVLNYFPSFADSMRMIAQQKIEEEKLKKLAKEKQEREAHESHEPKQADEEWAKNIRNTQSSEEIKSAASPPPPPQQNNPERSQIVTKSTAVSSTYSNHSRLTNKQSIYVQPMGILPSTLSDVDFPSVETGTTLPKPPPSPRPNLPGTLSKISDASRGRPDEQRLTIVGASESSDEDHKQNRSFIAGLVSRVSSFRNGPKYEVNRVTSPGSQISRGRTSNSSDSPPMMTRAEAPVLSSQNVDNIEGIIYHDMQQSTRVSTGRFQSIRTDHHSSYMNSRNTSILSSNRQSMFSTQRNSVLADRRQSQMAGARYSIVAERRMSTLQYDHRQSISSERRMSTGIDRRQSQAGGERRMSIQGERRSSIQGERRSSIQGERRSSIQGERRSSITGERRGSVARERRSSIGMDVLGSVAVPVRRGSIRRKSRVGVGLGPLPAALLAIDSATASYLPLDHPGISEEYEPSHQTAIDIEPEINMVDDLDLPQGMSNFSTGRRGSRPIPAPSFSIADSFGIRRLQTELRNDKKRMALLSQVARSDNLSDPYMDFIDGVDADGAMLPPVMEPQSDDILGYEHQTAETSDEDGNVMMTNMKITRRAPSVIQEEDEYSRRVTGRSIRSIAGGIGDGQQSGSAAVSTRESEAGEHVDDNDDGGGDDEENLDGPEHEGEDGEEVAEEGDDELSFEGEEDEEEDYYEDGDSQYDEEGDEYTEDGEYDEEEDEEYDIIIEEDENEENGNFADDTGETAEAEGEQHPHEKDDLDAGVDGNDNGDEDEDDDDVFIPVAVISSSDESENGNQQHDED